MEGSATSVFPTLYYRDSVTLAQDQSAQFARNIPPLVKDSLGVWLADNRWGNFMGKERWREALVMDLGRGNLLCPQSLGRPLPPADDGRGFPGADEPVGQGERVAVPAPAQHPGRPDAQRGLWLCQLPGRARFSLPEQCPLCRAARGVVPGQQRRPDGKAGHRRCGWFPISRSQRGCFAPMAAGSKPGTLWAFGCAPSRC